MAIIRKETAENAGNDAEKEESLYTADRNVNQSSQCENQYGSLKGIHCMAQMYSPQYIPEIP